MGQAILDVSAFPPAEQGDPLVQRRLDDARWLPNIPLAAYKDAKYEIAEGRNPANQKVSVGHFTRISS